MAKKHNQRVIKLLRHAKETRKIEQTNVWHISNTKNDDWNFTSTYIPAMCGVWFKSKERQTMWPVCKDCQAEVKTTNEKATQRGWLTRMVKKPKKIEEKIFAMPTGIPE